MRNERSNSEWKVKLAVMELLSQSPGSGFRLHVDHATLGPVEIVVGNEEYLRGATADCPVGVDDLGREAVSESRH